MLGTGDISTELHRAACKRNFRVNQTRFSNVIAGLAAASLAVTPAVVQAQASAPRGAIDLPETMNLLRANDPNLRTATAVVNGQVITRTDVEQRAALITAASQNELGEAELQRLRMQVLRNLIDEVLQVALQHQPTPLEGASTKVPAAKSGKDKASDKENPLTAH